MYLHKLSRHQREQKPTSLLRKSVSRHQSSRSSRGLGLKESRVFIIVALFSPRKIKTCNTPITPCRVVELLNFITCPQTSK